MRATIYAMFVIGFVVLAGCLDNGQTRYPRGSSSMYPLSTQQPALQEGETVVYQDPGMGTVSPGGAFCAVEDTSTASPITPITDPPVVVDNVYYPPATASTQPTVVAQAPAPVYTQQQQVYAPAQPVASAAIPPSRLDGRPGTFAERRAARGSPYDPLLRGTPYPAYGTSTFAAEAAPEYSAPVQSAPVYSAPVQTAPVYTPQTQTIVSTPVPVQTASQVNYQPVPTTTRSGQTATVQYGNTIILPDPPMVIRDASGRVDTVGMPAGNTLPLVRVPAEFAPSASGASMVQAAPPIAPVIVSPPSDPMPVYQMMPEGQPGATASAPASAAMARELRLVPAPDVAPSYRPNDAAPSQWFEIVRPGNVPIRIGRVSSTCVCVSVRVPNRFIGAGERALVEARIVSRPPVNNLTYGIFVSVLEPVNTMLDADVTIRLR